MIEIPLPKFKIYSGQPVRYIQPKLDGHLMRVYRSREFPNDTRILTKNDKDVTDKVMSISHIRQEIESIPLESIVFGELHCPRDFATNVPTRLNNADEELQLSIFAVPYFTGEKVTNDIDPDRLLNELRKYSIFTVTTSYILKDMYILQDHQIIELLRLAKEQKLEGWILKEQHMSGWYKLKPTKTIDVFVIGTQSSFSASNYGGLKSIIVAIFDNDGGLHDLGQVGSGFDHDFRMSIDRNSLLHRVCEIEFDSIAANGKLRFPRFLRWRYDKDWKSCTSEQLEN